MGGTSFYLVLFAHAFCRPTGITHSTEKWGLYALPLNLGVLIATASSQPHLRMRLKVDKASVWLSWYVHTWN